MRNSNDELPTDFLQFSDSSGIQVKIENDTCCAMRAHFKNCPSEDGEIKSSTSSCSMGTSDILNNSLEWTSTFLGCENADRLVEGVDLENCCYHKCVVEISLQDDVTDIYKLLDLNPTTLHLDLSYGPIGDHIKTIKRVKEAHTFLSTTKASTALPNILAVLSPHKPRTGRLKANKPHVELQLGGEVILTADRRYSHRSSSRVIYVNAKFLIGYLRRCDIIAIGEDIQLQVMRQVALSCACKVVFPGRLTAGMNVKFLDLEEDSYRLSVEELEDITFAMEMGLDIVVPMAAGDGRSFCESEELFQNIKYAMRELQCERMMLFSEVCLNTFEHSDRVNFFARSYDGFFMQLEWTKVVDVSTDSKRLMEQCHEQKKPIILSLRVTPDCLEQKPLLVLPDAEKYIFFYPDKYFLPQTHRNFFIKSFHDIFNVHTVKLPKLTFVELDASFEDKSTTGSDTFARSVVQTSYENDASVIILCSQSGRMGIKISHFRPNCPVVVVSNTNLKNYLKVFHNVWTVPRGKIKLGSIEAQIRSALSFCRARKFIYHLCQVLVVYRATKNVGYPNKFVTFTYNDDERNSAEISFIK